MGDCCSSNASNVTDGGALPEKKSLLKERENDNDSEDGTATKPTIEKEWQDAIENADNHKIKDLFRKHHKHYNFLAIKFDNGDNSLHRAVRRGNNKLVKFLLLLKIDVNMSNGDGNTGLHLAVITQNKAILELLLKQDKIDMTIKNNNNQTAKGIAISSNYNNIVQLLEKHEHLDETEPTNDILVDVNNRTSVAGSNSNSNTNSGKNSGRNSRRRSSVKNISESKTYEDDDGDTSATSAVDSTAEQLHVSSLTAPNNDQLLSSDDDDDNEKPILMGYLERKGKGMSSRWEKQWCVVTRSYILFSKKKIEIEDASSADTRKKFDDIINMTSVVSVVPKKSKKEQNKFVLSTSADGKPVNPHKPPNNKNELVLRCESETVRNQWVHKLIKHCKKVYNLSYLKSFNNLPGI